MPLTYNETVTLTTLTCFRCGVAFAIPQHLDRCLRNSGDTFYCPNGHSQAFVDSEVKKLTRELAQERQQHDQTKTELRNHKKRIARGICPCCGRTFKNIQRHIACKHPTFGK